MIDDLAGQSVEVAAIQHKQALFEAETFRRQRNGFYAGSIVTAVASGVLEGAEVINGSIAWGPRFIAGALILKSVERGFKLVDARTKAKEISERFSA